MTDRERVALTLAAAHYRNEGERLNEARSSLGLNSVRFYALVARLIEDPAVEAAMPVEVRRLRRIRDARLRVVHKTTQRVA